MPTLTLGTSAVTRIKPFLYREGYKDGYSGELPHARFSRPQSEDEYLQGWTDGSSDSRLGLHPVYTVLSLNLD